MFWSENVIFEGSIFQHFSKHDIFSDISVLFQYSMDYDEGKINDRFQMSIWRVIDLRKKYSMIVSFPRDMLQESFAVVNFHVQNQGSLVQRIILIDRSGWKGSSFCGIRFSKAASSSVSSVSLRIVTTTDCYNNVMVCFWSVLYLDFECFDSLEWKTFYIFGNN